MNRWWKRAFRAGLIALLSSGAPLPASVVLNEVMASNYRTLADEDGEYADWVEVYNNSDQPIVLFRYGLSDDPGNPFRWSFPPILLPAREFLLVWLSGKDRAGGSGYLHAGFSLKASGETLTLTSPGGKVVDQVDLPRLARDQSWGRAGDGGDSWVAFEQPTPLQPNPLQGGLGALPSPEFSHPAGYHPASFDLHLSCPDPEATILFTTDGSIPSASRLGGETYDYRTSYPQERHDPPGTSAGGRIETMVYAFPIPVHDRSDEPDRLSPIATSFFSNPSPDEAVTPSFKAIVVRARAVKEGWVASPVVTRTFLVAAPDRFAHPVISLSVDEPDLFSYETGMYVPGLQYELWRAQTNDPLSPQSGANYHDRSLSTVAHLEWIEGDHPPALSQEVELRVHGLTSRVQPQKSLRLHALRSLGTEWIEHAVFPGLRAGPEHRPLTRFKRLVLRNSGQDSGVWWMQSPIGTGTRFRDGFVHALIRPFALDSLAWRPAIHLLNGEYWGMINLRERLDRHFLAAHHGLREDQVALLEDDARLEAGSEEDRRSFLALRTLLPNLDFSLPGAMAEVDRQMDVDHFLRYAVSQVYIANADWPGNNQRMWRSRIVNHTPFAPPTHDGRWRWIPYDLDFAFGAWNVDGNTLRVATAEDGLAWPNPPWSTVFLRHLLRDRSFSERFIRATLHHMHTTFNPVRVEALVGEFQSMLTSSYEEHRRRWPFLGDPQASFLVEFARLRPAYMRQHLADYFGLGGDAEVTVHIARPEGGTVQVEGIRISEWGSLSEAGMGWQGTFLQGVPVELEATPAPGFLFYGWEDSGLRTPLPHRRNVVLALDGPLSLHPVFGESPWPDAFPVSEKLAWSPWYGWMGELDLFPWIFHFEHGWQFVRPPFSGYTPVYDLGVNGWWLLHPDLHPWIYHASEPAGWILPLPGSGFGERWFYHADLDRILQEGSVWGDPL